MKILITGTNGAIGKEIAQRLKKNKKNKLILFGRKRDLTKPINLNLKPEVVIHCAAKHPFSKKGRRMRNIYSTNMKITKNVINFCNNNDVNNAFDEYVNTCIKYLKFQDRFDILQSEYSDISDNISNNEIEYDCDEATKQIFNN